MNMAIPNSVEFNVKHVISIVKVAAHCQCCLQSKNMTTVYPLIEPFALDANFLLYPEYASYNVRIWSMNHFKV